MFTPETALAALKRLAVVYGQSGDPPSNGTGRASENSCERTRRPGLS